MNIVVEYLLQRFNGISSCLCCLHDLSFIEKILLQSKICHKNCYDRIKFRKIEGEMLPSSLQC